MPHNRFSCLKPTDTTDTSGNAYKAPGRNNRFSHSSKKTNSRWQRSKSPEKNSRFPTPENRNNFVKNQRDGRDSRDSRDSRDRPRFNKGGFGKFRYNHGRRGPSRFDHVKKDSMGRPMLANATTGGFDINAALKNSKIKQKKEKKKKKREIKKEPELVPIKKKSDEISEEQKKAEDDWNRQMILNMQWETDSEEDEEENSLEDE